MSERAHPDDRGFQDHWVWQRRCNGLLPWPQRLRSPWKQGLLERYRFCQRFVAGRRVLDAPCGCGWGTSLLKRTRRLVGVDRDAESIAYARRQYGHRAEFFVADMQQLPLECGAFDVVICLEGIEHVDGEVGAQFVREAARVLAPTGHLILTSPEPDPRRARNPYHLREYARAELEALLAPYFTPEQVVLRPVGGVSVVYYVGIVRSRKLGGTAASMDGATVEEFQAVG